MNLKDVARIYKFHPDRFQQFCIRLKPNGYHSGFFDDVIDDDHVEEIAAMYKNYRMAEIEEENDKKAALPQILITSGFNFDGYRIVKYSGYISGDDAIQVDRGWAGTFDDATDVGAALMDSIKKIRRNALQELKEQAYDLGCNAVIGVSFDYINIEPETANKNHEVTYLPYVFGVTANGNAVIIEKDDTK